MPIVEGMAGRSGSSEIAIERRFQRTFRSVPADSRARGTRSQDSRWPGQHEFTGGRDCTSPGPTASDGPAPACGCSCSRIRRPAGRGLAPTDRRGNAVRLEHALSRASPRAVACCSGSCWAICGLPTSPRGDPSPYPEHGSVSYLPGQLRRSRSDADVKIGRVVRWPRFGAPASRGNCVCSGD